MNPRATTRNLLDQLEHRNFVVAVEAAKSLADRRGPHVLSGLTRILRSARRAQAREASAYALAWLRSRKAIDPLLACAADKKEHDTVRGQAMEGLANHLQFAVASSRKRVKAERLMSRLLTSRSPVLRFWACFGVGSLGCRSAVPRLRELAASDPGVCPGWWFVREEAEDALDWIAGRPGQERVPIHLRKAARPRRRTPKLRSRPTRC